MDDSIPTSSVLNIGLLLVQKYEVNGDFAAAWCLLCEVCRGDTAESVVEYMIKMACDKAGALTLQGVSIVKDLSRLGGDLLEHLLRKLVDSMSFKTSAESGEIVLHPLVHSILKGAAAKNLPGMSALGCILGLLCADMLQLREERYIDFHANREIERACRHNEQPSLPSGSILMWSGNTRSLPETWVLCNGQNGTPYLRDHFILAAGGSHRVDHRAFSDRQHDYEVSGEGKHEVILHGTRINNQQSWWRVEVIEKGRDAYHYAGVCSATSMHRSSLLSFSPIAGPNWFTGVSGLGGTLAAGHIGRNSRVSLVENVGQGWEFTFDWSTSWLRVKCFPGNSEELSLPLLNFDRLPLPCLVFESNTTKFRVTVRHPAETYTLAYIMQLSRGTS